MNVYLLYHGSYSDRFLLGVFATYEGAATSRHDPYGEPPDHVPQWVTEGPDHREARWSCDWTSDGSYPSRCQFEIEERVVTA